MYHISNTNISLFIDKFNEIIKPLKSSHEIIVFGDFNINLFNDENNKNMFEYFLQYNYIISTILGANRLAIKQDLILTYLSRLFAPHYKNSSILDFV